MSITASFNPVSSKAKTFRKNRSFSDSDMKTFDSRTRSSSSQRSVISMNDSLNSDDGYYSGSDHDHIGKYNDIAIIRKRSRTNDTTEDERYLKVGRNIHSYCRHNSNEKYNHRERSKSRCDDSIISSTEVVADARVSGELSKTSCSNDFVRDPWFEDLPIEWWERNDLCKEAKSYHLNKIDTLFGDREELVLQTTLWRKHTVLERNMFPYDTPKGIEHFTLWSRSDLSHEEIVKFVDGWLKRKMPQVRRWQYDDNSGERSISLFHVHVFVETIPYSFVPRPEEVYYPSNAIKNISTVDGIHQK